MEGNSRNIDETARRTAGMGQKRRKQVKGNCGFDMALGVWLLYKNCLLRKADSLRISG